MNNRQIGVLYATGFILCIPLIAMQYTQEVNSSVFDFLVAAFLMIGFGLGCERITRNIKKSGLRIGVVVLSVTILILIWMELAVGIFGSPLSGN
ncbi:MAG: hypothetical protein HRU40_03490 [Saprospiraceae bacterium]|nr:hypothetical protein [Saprospiraceae bacterium]